MNTQGQHCFITGKIQELQTAILNYHTDSVLKLPSEVVQTLHVDEIGCLWIAISKPVQFVNEFDRSFYVTLNYYKKGIPFFLNTYGLARIVSDPEETSQLPLVLKEEHNKGKLVLCVRILKANYYKKQHQVVQTLLQKCRQSISTFFSESNGYDHFSFDENKHYA
ncbi:MAG: hypothetical protein SGI96_14250 [Bacteroidota bacterium]|nr:hypothetical protein [Bacteroidota bacterium]